MVDPREGFLFTLLGFAFLLISIFVDILLTTWTGTWWYVLKTGVGFHLQILGVGYFRNESC